MAETILTPPTEETSENQDQVVENVTYLVKDNFLGEFETEEDKDLARRNIKAAYADQTFNKKETIDEITSRIAAALEMYANFDPDDYITTSDLNDLKELLIFADGSKSFTGVLLGETPDNAPGKALTTKNYVTNILKNYLKVDAEEEILNLVSDMLSKYALASNVYNKNSTYDKSAINSLLSAYVKKDGSTPFTAAQSCGAKPTINNHLTNKGYVDSLMATHKADIDPHGFIEILNNKLKKYALKDNVLDKTLTYTRALINSIIDKLVEEAVDLALLEYMSLYDPHDIISKVKKLGYVLKNGSTPFTAPLQGVDAVNDYDLVTLHQVSEAVENKEAVWITSGPVETTVGYVEDNSEVPATMTFLEIMDAIFYGKTVSIHVPEYVMLGNTGEIELCVHGSLGMFLQADLYLNEELIYTFSKEDFEDGCVTVNSKTIDSDTDFVFKVLYTNDTELEETASIKCAMPVFVGLLPKWKFAANVNMDYLQELIGEDSYNNQFIEQGPNLTSITVNYNFVDVNQRTPFIVVPSNYPDLVSMVTKSLSFGIDAFTISTLILQVAGKDVEYKIYDYKQALVSLNLDVTFNFS